MNQIHVEAAGESPSAGEQNVPARSSASRGGTLTTPIQDRGGPPRRILVVDDDGDIRQFCADALTVTGHRVDTAEDGVAG
jgi:PleD family two-component response regulator